eukprot:Awhi_evm1s12817
MMLRTHNLGSQDTAATTISSVGGATNSLTNKNSSSLQMSLEKTGSWWFSQ